MTNHNKNTSHRVSSTVLLPFLPFCARDRNMPAFASEAKQRINQWMSQLLPRPHTTITVDCTTAGFDVNPPLTESEIDTVLHKAAQTMEPRETIVLAQILDPTSERHACQRIGRLCLDKGQPDLALTYLRRGDEDGDGDLNYQQELGVALSLTGNDVDAGQLLLDAVVSNMPVE